MKVTLPHAKHQTEILRTLKAAFVLKLSPKATLLIASFRRRNGLGGGKVKVPRVPH